MLKMKKMKQSSILQLQSSPSKEWLPSTGETSSLKASNASATTFCRDLLTASLLKHMPISQNVPYKWERLAWVSRSKTFGTIGSTTFPPITLSSMIICARKASGSSREEMWRCLDRPQCTFRSFKTNLTSIDPHQIIKKLIIKYDYKCVQMGA